MGVTHVGVFAEIFGRRFVGQPGCLHFAPMNYKQFTLFVIFLTDTKFIFKFHCLLFNLNQGG